MLQAAGVVKQEGMLGGPPLAVSKFMRPLSVHDSDKTLSVENACVFFAGTRSQHVRSTRVSSSQLAIQGSTDSRCPDYLLKTGRNDADRLEFFLMIAACCTQD